MQGLSPEHLEGSQPLPTSSPEGSPWQSEVPAVTTPQVEWTVSLEHFWITNTQEDFRLHPDSERQIMRVNSSGDLVVVSSGSPIGPFLGIEGQDPFWSMGIFRRDLFGAGSGIEITISPVFPEASNPDTIPFTTAYYFPGTDTPPANHILTIPLQTVHYTLVPGTTSPHTGIIAASQAPIGMPLSPRFTPTLLPIYHALNASIPTPSQISSGTPGISTPSGHHLVPGFIPTLPRPIFRGPLPSSIRGTDPSGTILSFTPNY